ncbi:hypothetical protein pipiens_009480 [Culex pipiens pipiens]|uniref:Uncharacterized protein n=1 Tax=Culex pipiens pipiens TaxID=38569 RepID=A0ABD1DDM9_CULPP
MWPSKCILVLLSLTATCFASLEKLPRKEIVLEDRYHYIVIGSDHVAQSVGVFLAKRNVEKSVLVLRSNHCERILEPAADAAITDLGRRVADKFTECAHQLGYQFVDPAHRGERAGVACAARNRTCKRVDSGQQQTLYAIDPNLKLLTGARLVRLLYNLAAAAVHGVEIQLGASRKYIFADKDVIIAGRCANDYRHLVTSSIVSNVALQETLRNVPVDFALSSPIVAPVLHTESNVTLAQSPVLLPTELFIRGPECNEEDGVKPNARLGMIMGNANVDNRVWIGFVPSIFSNDPSYLPSHEETVKIVSHALKVAATIADCDAFQRLQLTPLDQRILQCAKYVGTLQYWTCHVDFKLRLFEKKAAIFRHNTALLSDDFRVNGVRALRLIPFGLTTPFLEQQWNRIFPLQAEPQQDDAPLPVDVAESTSPLVQLIRALRGSVNRAKRDDVDLVDFLDQLVAKNATNDIRKVDGSQEVERADLLVGISKQDLQEILYHFRNFTLLNSTTGSAGHSP